MASNSDSDCSRKRKDSLDEENHHLKKAKDEKKESSDNSLEDFGCFGDTQEFDRYTGLYESHASSDPENIPLEDTEGTLEDASINDPEKFVCNGNTQEYTLKKGLSDGDSFPKHEADGTVVDTSINNPDNYVPICKTQEYSLQNGVNDKHLKEKNNQDCNSNTQEYSMKCPSVGIDSTTEHQYYNDTDEDRTGEKCKTKCTNQSEPKMKEEYKNNEVIPLKKFTSVQRDAELISGIIPGMDVSSIYDEVLKNRAKEYRVDLVTNELLENGTIDRTDEQNEINTVQSSSCEDIFQDVAEILIKFPNADPNKVYEMLEQQAEGPQRMVNVLQKLSSTCTSKCSSDTSVSGNSVSVTSSDKSNDLLSDPAFRSNPLYKDLRTLRKVMPDKDPNELYAFLEAHFDKANRVQIVIDELTKSESQESLLAACDTSLEDVDKGKAPMTTEDKLQSDLKQMTDIFKDCDPNFLYEKLNDIANDPDRVTKLAMELFEHKNYPKLKDILEKEKKTDIKNRITKMTYNMQDFLRKFPNPLSYFADTDRLVNQNYKEHVLVYLKNTYPFLKDGFIKVVVEKTKHHLSPAVLEVESVLEDIMDRSSKKKRTTPRTEVLDYPDDPEELFFQEVMFCQHKEHIEVYLEEAKRLRDVKIASARDSGELLECSCCFDDECLLEDMQACADGHLFCKECIQRSTAAAIGDGRTNFLCLTGTCEQQFPLTVLQQVLPAATFSLALRKKQEEELRQADIPDLVTCPFCSFATIMPDPEDKVMKCLNEDCLKESCRLCKEPNHVPLRCNEVEKQGETNMRTFIETKMSEAMLRTCPRCKKRFYKEMGCNKMTCTCGETMCYVCRMPGIDYSHFNEGSCNDYNDVFTLHNKEMLEAAEQARTEYLEQHPEQSDDLKYDPVKLLEKMKKRWGDGGGDDGYDDDDDDGYDDEMEDEDYY